MSELLSVILIARNGMPFAERAIASVLAQTYRDYELIIVDDGSSDHTTDVCGRIRRRCPRRMEIIRLDEVRGQGKAMTLGLRACRGEVVSLLHSDDQWLPGKLQAVAEAFHDSSNTVAHYHDMQIMLHGKAEELTYRSIPKVRDVYETPPRSPALDLDVPGSSLSFSRAALSRIGPIPAAITRRLEIYLLDTALRYGNLSVTDAVLGRYNVPDCDYAWLNEYKIDDVYSRNLIEDYARVFCQKRGFQRDARPVALQMRHDHVSGINALKWQKGDHVLMIRSVPSSILWPCIGTLLDKGVHVHLLAPRSFAAGSKSRFFHLHEIAEGMIDHHSIPDAVVDDLRGLQLKCAIILYAMPRHRYFNVHLALAVLNLDCPKVGIAHARQCRLPFDAVGNTERILALKDKHAGKRAFLIGNGPSLCAADLDRLKGEITFAANKIYLMYDQTDWRPTYYMVEDTLVAEQNIEPIEAVTGSSKLFVYYLPEYLEQPFYGGLYYPMCNRTTKAFGMNAAHVLYWGATVVYTMIQLACYMGIRELYLIGVDSSYNTPVNVDPQNATIVISTGEQNHFHPNYSRPGEKWHDPKQGLQREYLDFARKTFEQMGGRIFNATRGGQLEALKRVDLDAVL